MKPAINFDQSKKNVRNILKKVDVDLESVSRVSH